MKERWITIDVSDNAPEMHPDALPDRAPDPAVARAYAWTLAFMVAACAWLVLWHAGGCSRPAPAMVYPVGECEAQRAEVDAIEAEQAERGAE